MNNSVKWIKYAAITFGLLLAVSIIYSLVSGALLFVKGFGLMESGDQVTEEGGHTITETYTGEIDSLFITYKAGNVIIKPGNSFKIEATDDISIKEKDGKIVITDNRKINFMFSFLNNKSISNLIVTMPSETILKELKLKLDAGRCEISGITTEELTLKQGAGEIVAKNLKASFGILEGGAGKIDITESELNDFKVDAGVGLINIEGIITGNTEVDCGVDQINLSINDIKDNYFITADQGIGAINVNGQSVPEGGLGLKSAPNKIDVDGGVGMVEIVFK